MGCGPGFYAAAIADRGATVTALDGSAELLRIAERAAGERGTFVRHDLEQPLPLADASFDLAVMALVYHHVHARQQLLAELRRVLRPGGRLLVSTTHPMSEQRWLGGSYYEGGRVEAPVGGPGPGFSINFERMTVERFVNEMLDGGFVLERLLEPRPSPELRDVDAAKFEALDVKRDGADGGVAATGVDRGPGCGRSAPARRDRPAARSTPPPARTPPPSRARSSRSSAAARTTAR